MRHKIGLLLLLFITIGMTQPTTPVQASPVEQEYFQYRVEPGDSWRALAWRFDLPAGYLQALNPHINPAQPPAIGHSLFVPSDVVLQEGVLVTAYSLTLQAAVAHGASPWSIALRNGLRSPYHPTLGQPLFIPQEGAAPRDLPAGFTALEVSQMPAQPGQAVGVRGIVSAETAVSAALNGIPLATTQETDRWVALTGTGAFFGTAMPLLTIQSGSHQWQQPWYFADTAIWDVEQITLTGSAAQIDAESIAAERARLFEIWNIPSPGVWWDAPFRLPLDSYVSISSNYGARRSYNSGPYRSYHEGVDFAAYGGTPVYAPAAGTVVVAENLYVRGGAVILDHGSSVYSGYYHLSELFTTPGQQVAAGALIGAVGTTGLSTGNHLHWDLLVNGVWIDGWAWQETEMDCWILEGLNRPCPPDK